MESLSETTWDVVICGTGLQQSLLALALSRSDKKILHLDPNGYYGGAEAAFSLQEADAWAEAIAQAPSSAAQAIFTAAAVTRPSSSSKDDQAAPTLAFPRAYALALCPQLIHARSRLLSQLVSSRAFRQLEFLAVGSFFICQPSSSSSSSSDAASAPVLTRIPSTREDVFSSAALSARAKRQLMKFLKLVLAYQDDEDEEASSRPLWAEFADKPLAAFLEDKMGLADEELRMYIITLTLSLDGGDVRTKEGLETIHRHLTSMGVFGPGFAALYPKWGGGSEIAQVACRAGAVGGGIYMLGTGIKEELSRKTKAEGEDGGEEEEEQLVELVLTDDTVVKTRLLVRGSDTIPDDGDKAVIHVSKLIAIVGTPFTHLFEPTVEGCPVPAVAVVAFPPGSVKTDNGAASAHPIFAIIHSSDTGECPAGQCTLYLHTIQTPDSKALLETAVSSLLQSAPATRTETEEDGSSPSSASLCLYQLYYEQKSSRSSVASASSNYFDFPTPSVSLPFDDTTLEPVQQAWAQIMGNPTEDDDVEFMVFADREGVGDDDDFE